MDALKLLKDTFSKAGYAILPRDELMITVIEKAYKDEVQMAIAALFNLTERVANIEDILKGPLTHVPNNSNYKKPKLNLPKSESQETVAKHKDEQ